MKYEIYIDNSKEWRWRLKAANGRIIADSGEGYTTKQACREDIDRVKDSKNAAVEEV